MNGLTWKRIEDFGPAYDLITCYSMAPSEDAMESKERAITNLIDRLENKNGKPTYKAWIPVPIL